MIPTEKIKEFCRTNDIEFLGIFGSYAKGDFNKDSDIDVMIRLKERKGFLEFIKMERILGQIMHGKVDMVTENSISKYLKDTIKKEVKVLYEG